MNFKKRTRLSAEVNMSSLTDIIFFLLVFFLIVSTLINPNVIKLTLPNSKKSSIVDLQQVVVNVDKDLKYYVNKTPVTFGELEAALGIELRRTRQATVVLRFDNSLSVQDLVDVLQIGDRLKVKMILATKPSNG